MRKKKMMRTPRDVICLVLVGASLVQVAGSLPIRFYNRAVPIPASSEVLFSMLNGVDGSYHFGYDTGTQEHQSYREEKREPSGKVTGKYGYVDPGGVLRVVEYEADHNGFRSKTTTRVLVNSEPPSFIGPIPFPLFRDNNDIS